MKIIMMVLLLAFAGDAFAADGWVMWEGWPQRGDGQWRPIDGFNSLDDCKKKRTELFKRWLELFPEFLQKKDEQVTIWEPSKSIMIGKVVVLDYVCPPNGTDPRPKS